MLRGGNSGSGGGSGGDWQLLLSRDAYRARDHRLPTLGKAPDLSGSSSPRSAGSRSARTVSQMAKIAATSSWTNLLLVARAAHVLWDGLRTGVSLPGPFCRAGQRWPPGVLLAPSRCRCFPVPARLTPATLPVAQARQAKRSVTSVPLPTGGHRRRVGRQEVSFDLDQPMDEMLRV